MNIEKRHRDSDHLGSGKKIKKMNYNFDKSFSTSSFLKMLEKLVQNKSFYRTAFVTHQR